MTLTTHGIREGSKVDRPDDAKLKEREKEKEKAEEDEGSSDQGKKKAEEKEEGKAALTWWVKKDMRKNGMKEMSGMILMKAIGPMIKTGMKAIGPMMICTILMSMDTSRRKEKEKEKERKARKARLMMAKEENQEMAKVSPTMFNLRPRRLLPYKTWYLFSVTNMAILIIFGAWFRLRLTLLEALHPFREVLPGDLL